MEFQPFLDREFEDWRFAGKEQVDFAVEYKVRTCVVGAFRAVCVLFRLSLGRADHRWCERAAIVTTGGSRDDADEFEPSVAGLFS